MTLPWETVTTAAPVSMPAEAMTPDVDSLPVTATNRVTGERVNFDISPMLREAIQSTIDAAVAQNPVMVAAGRAVAGRERPDRTLMQSSILDVLVAIVAALFTVVSPESPVTGVLWVVAAAMAGKTLIEAALSRVLPEGVT